MVDAPSAQRLCTLYPLDKRANAGGVRQRADPGSDDDGANGADEPAPLLRRILDEQAATGLPALWLPHTERPAPGTDDEHGEC